MIAEVLVFILTTILSYYYYAYKRVHNHYETRGIKFLAGVPIFGNIIGSTLLRRHFWEDLDEVYRAFPDERYVGYFEGTFPMIIVRDPELIKILTINDFNYFPDHRPFVPVVDPLFEASIFVMPGDVWRDMRSVLRPSLTSSKVRQVMPSMVEVCENFLQHLKGQENENVDVEEILRRYTNDCTARAAFGFEVNSFKVKDNDLHKIGKKLFDFTLWQRIQMLAVSHFPDINKIVRIHLWGKKTTDFFRKMYTNTVKYRSEHNVERPDMIQAMMETTKEWHLDQLAGQIFFNYVAGFESTAAVPSMCIHELAINPGVQDKLYQEIRQFKEKYRELTYDNISELNYLHCVLNETFRKWSPAIVMDRVCAKSYELPPPREGGRPYRMKPGDIIYNSVNSLHWDPKYFPEPEKFIPERFADDNKYNIKPFTFMPFGMGPRNCIGYRFAVLLIKLLLYNVVLNYKIMKCSKTTDPLELRPQDFNIRPKGGTWVIFEPRY